MQDPTLSADEIVEIVDYCKEPVPTYHNGIKTDMKAAKVNMIKALEKVHIPEMPVSLSGNGETALPVSPSGITIFYEGKGVKGKVGGEYAATTAGNFDTGEKVFAAAGEGFVFDSELFRKQGGGSVATITVTIVNTLGQHYRRLTFTRDIPVN